jgi:hypothetical protein
MVTMCAHSIHREKQISSSADTLPCKEMRSWGGDVLIGGRFVKYDTSIQCDCLSSHVHRSNSEVGVILAELLRHPPSPLPDYVLALGLCLATPIAFFYQRRGCTLLQTTLIGNRLCILLLSLPTKQSCCQGTVDHSRLWPLARLTRVKNSIYHSHTSSSDHSTYKGPGTIKTWRVYIKR